MKWDVLCNCAGGEPFYQVYRKKREGEPLHGGNMETDGRIYDSKEAAEAVAERRNEVERKKEELGKALEALGYRKSGESLEVRAVFFAQGRAKVSMDGEYFGIYDFDRRTFVD